MKFKRKTLKYLSGILITVLLITGIVFALPTITDGLIYLLKLFLPFIIAYVFALIVNPLMRKLTAKLKFSRTVSALVIIVSVIGGLGGLASWILYWIVRELKNVYVQLPQIYANVSNGIEALKAQFRGFYEMLPINIQEALRTVSDSLSVSMAELINTKSIPMVSGAGNIAMSVPTILITTIVFILASFFIISDFERVNTFVKKPFSKKTQDKFALLNQQVKKYLGGYIKAQCIIMSVVFMVLFAGLSILDVDYALIIALGTAFFDALPFFGSGAVLWPWSIISFVMGDIKLGFGLIIMYVTIIIVRQTIEPKIVSKKIGMNPLLTLMSMYLGFKILSVGGMILGPIIMMLVFSLYKANIFDGLISLIKNVWLFIVTRLYTARERVKRFWESE